MKGIIITSHGPMAAGVVNTSRLFFGIQPQLKACCYEFDSDPQSFTEELKNAINEVDDGSGVIVLCDLLFGVPCDCLSLIISEDMPDRDIVVITGFNLMMLLQIMSIRETNDPDIGEVIRIGHSNIADLKHVLLNNEKNQE
ncbi:MAG: PTS sugar transporter subunit IIA [Erysipelotrichaceae bacterium]|nr:PTS sugar transporter subunit IIA [Erysipelotrichaceae bacterium]